jgi:hypothetical protein
MKTKTETVEVGASSLFSAKDQEVMQGVMMKVIASGFVPASVLRAEFGDSETTKALAILHKTYRALVECREPWEGQEVLGLKLAERRFSQAEIKKMPAALAFLPELFKAVQNKYGEYQRIVVRCRWTTPVLGALPRMTDEKTPEKILAFERNWTKKDIVIQRYGLRAMLKRALELTNRSGYAAERFGFETITVRDPKITTDHIRGMIDDRGNGLGTIRSECLAAGTEFVIGALVPTTYLAPSDYLSVLKIAGAMVGLSPGRSAGYGDFEIVGVEQ